METIPEYDTVIKKILVFLMDGLYGQGSFYNWAVTAQDSVLHNNPNGVGCVSRQGTCIYVNKKKQCRMVWYCMCVGIFV
jgi:hypothetical protein